MAAAGHQAEVILEETRAKHKGQYILAVEGNPPLNEGGMFCIDGGKPFVEKLKMMAEDAMAIIAWGACASWGCVQAAKPNPTQATPIDKVIANKPIIKVPGCPPIAEVMTGVVTFITTFGKLPELDRQGRPKMFYSQRIHDKCYRRPHFDAGQFIEEWDDEAARARAIVSTRWAAKARPPTTPARPCAGMAAFPSRSSRAMAASAARKTDSGTRVRSTTVSPTSSSSASRRTPTRSAWWRPEPSVRQSPRMQR
ncbi:NiFe hydrogenase small subunit HydA [Bradyrhizobium sp. LM3.2]